MPTASRSSDPSPDGRRALRAEPILVVDDIVKRFETPDGILTAVDHVSFSVAPGEFLSVIVPSGCGKSTLLNVIGGLIPAYDGRAVVEGATISGPHAAIGMVFQEESTFPWRTVVENVAFPLEIAGVPKAQRFDRARHFTALVGTCRKARKKISSGSSVMNTGSTASIWADPSTRGRVRS